MKKINIFSNFESFSTHRSAIILTFLISIVGSSGFSQPVNSTIKDVSMPAPNAAALGKYGDIPVSYFTGVPNIDIPIYTVQEGSLSVPVSLSYHASGIKIGEPASWVGMGWSLNGGGIISRTTLGRPDDAVLGYYWNGASLVDPDNVLPTNDPNFPQKDEVAEGIRDAEPDLFSFNFNGYAGKFIIDKDKVIHQIPKSDLKIKIYTQGATSGIFYRFEITASDGTRFLFGNLPGEAVDSYSGTEFQYFAGQNSGDYAPSSWYLRRIETADQKFNIDFNYEDEYYSYKTLASANVHYPLACGGGVTSSCGLIPISPGTCANETTIKGKRLSQIITSTTILNFVATTEREDLEAPLALAAPGGGTPSRKRLEQIEIKRNGLTHCDKKYKFTYLYMQSPSGTTSQYKRLWLDKVQGFSCDETISEGAWDFQYVSGTLPNRLSKQIDHWGFYNGATTNEGTQNIPPIWVHHPETGSLQPPYATANRNPDFAFAQIGTLNKITYPTGGNTEFTYEGHDYHGSVTTVTGNTSFIYLSNCSFPAANCCTNTSVNANCTLTSANLQGAKFRLSVDNLTIPPYQFCTGNNVNVQVQMTLASGGSVIATYAFNLSNTQPSYTITQFVLPTFPMQPGVAYKFTMIVTGEKGTFEIFKPISTTTFQNVTAGGIRIKQIKSNDGIAATNDIIKTYKYRATNNANNSSGVLYQKPIYVQYYRRQQPDGTLEFQGVRAMATAVVPLTGFTGYHIGYEYVTEENNGSGKSLYSFISEIPPFTANYNADSLGLAPPRLFVAKDGQQTTEKVYDEGGTILKSSSNLIDNPGYYPLPGVIYQCIKLPYPDHPCNNPTTTLNWREYTPRSGTFRLKSVTQVSDGVSSTTSYTYDAKKRFESPITIKTTNSDGKITLIQHTYPHNLKGCFGTFLVNKNIISQPYKTIINVDNVQVGGSETVFAAFNSTSGAFVSASATVANCAVTNFIRPYKFKNYEVTWNNGTLTTGTWAIKGTINNYNSKGLAATFTTENWPAETYEWEPSGLIKKRTYNSTFVWEYSYIPGTRLVASIKDIDGQKTFFAYDKLMRLEKSWARPTTTNDTTTATVKTNNFYQYKTSATTQNFVRSYTKYKTVAGSDLNTQMTTQYMDGLGRPIQTVGRKQSPALKDVVSIVEYDKYGRQKKAFLPFEGTNSDGSFVETANVPSGLLYTLQDYELNPLNRIQKVTPPDWYPTMTTFGANAANEVRFDLTSATSYYTAGLLSKTIVIEPDPATTKTGTPNGNKTITFKDKKGRTILVRRTDNAGGNVADTYYVYDDKDRLIKVVPPGASLVTGSETPNLIFQYTYDGQDLMLTKKVPDAALVNMKYNDRDQLVLEQDGNLLAQNKWKCTHFDDFGRLDKSGLLTTTLPSPIPLTLTPDDIYTENIYGTSGIELGKLKTFNARIIGTTDWLSTTNIFDAYGRIIVKSGNSHLNLTPATDESTMVYDYADHLLAEYRYFTPGSGTPTTRQIAQNHLYDHWGRLKTNKFGVDGAAVTTVSEMAYNYRDQLTEKNLGKTATSHLQSLDFAYNSQGWLTTINTPTLNSGTNQPLVLCTTNPVAPAPTAGSTLDGNDLFYMDLKYDALSDVTGMNSTAQKNGNISQVFWRTRGRERQAYSLTYDFLNRMTTANYADITDAGAGTINDKFKESLTYDIRGNISTLQRNGLYKTTAAPNCWTNGMIDNLNYTYLSGTNKLSKIVDNATDATAKKDGWDNPQNAPSTATYVYDANGNMIADPYKGFSIFYNFLNLPYQFAVPDGGDNYKLITITYDGTGRKLTKKVTNGAALVYQQDYVNGIEYRNVSTTGSNRRLEAIYHPEGRVFNDNVSSSTTESLRYEYAIKDHLGNSRLTFSDINGNGTVDFATEVLQENHYYPFGLNMKGAWINDAASLDNKYQYNGKELNDDFGLNWNDYGARWYDASVGRWWSVDPLAEKTKTWSPYNYVFSNPLKYIDPFGLTGEPSISGNTITIRSDVIFYGDIGDNKKALKKEVKRTEKAWNAAKGKVKIDGKEYKVKYQISAKFDTNAKTLSESRKNNGEGGGKTHIEVGSEQNTRTSDGGGSGYLNTADIMNSERSFTHEYGHENGWLAEDDISTHDDKGIPGEKGNIPGIMTARNTSSTGFDPDYTDGKKIDATKRMDPQSRDVNRTINNGRELLLEKIKEKIK